MRHIYLICPVRNPTFDCAEIVAAAEADGNVVHWPPRDVGQEDPTGFRICSEHLAAMRDCDEVWAVWDVNSKGSHFDLGMAFALGKKVKVVKLLQPDTEGKSYVKVMREMR